MKSEIIKKVNLNWSKRSLAMRGNKNRAKKMKTNLEKLIEIRDIQCSEGNYDQSEYMRGLANGLILAVATMIDEAPVLKTQVTNTEL